MENNFDTVLGSISVFIPTGLFEKLWARPANTSIKELRQILVEELPEGYPQYDKIMDILNEALS